MPDIVICICNQATLDVEFAASVPAEDLSISGLIVWPPVNQPKKRILSKYWNLAET